MATTEPRLTNLIAEQCDVAESRVTADTRFAELPDWSSFAALRLLNAVEETFEVYLDLRRFFEAETISDLAAMITSESKLTSRERS